MDTETPEKIQEFIASVLSTSHGLTAHLGIRDNWPAELLRFALAYTRAETGLLFEVDRVSGMLVKRAEHGGVSPQLVQDVSEIAFTQTHRPLDKQRWVMTGDAAADVRLGGKRSFRNGAITQAAIFPMVLAAEEQAVGAIFLGSRHDTMPLDEGLKRILESYAQHFGEMYRVHRAYLQCVRDAVKAKRVDEEPLREIRLLGSSDAVDRLERALGTIAGTNLTVSLIGEAGTGRRQIAEQIHHASPRDGHPFLVEDMELGDEAAQMELLFGGPRTTSKGSILRKAQGGTLVLQNADKMAPGVQLAVIRAMEAGRATATGGKRSYQVDLRLVVILEMSLQEFEISDAFHPRFRQKIALFPLYAPPLRDRLEDVPQLIEAFVAQANRQFGKNIQRISEEAMDRLCRWQWPGNIRELRKEVFDGVLRASSQRQELHVVDLHPRLVESEVALVGDRGEGTLRQQLASLERKILMARLEAVNHNQSQAARDLGLSRQTLINKLNKYGIKSGRDVKKQRRQLTNPER